MIEEKIYCNGTFIQTDDLIEVVNPYNKKVKKSGKATTAHLKQAIEGAQNVEKELQKLPSHTKKKILNQIADTIEKRKQDFIDTLIFESAKPFIYAKGEVERGVQTFRVAAEEAGRHAGEYLDLDWTQPGEGRTGIVRRFPIGIVGGIAPFNFPLNLVAHKVAPAIAAGCPIILKPASKTPLTALLLAEVVDETDLPKGAFSVLPCDRETGNMLVTSENIKLLSFTGSPEVGWKMKKNAGKKKVVLELGGNAAAIIHKDADLNHAVERMLIGGYAYSGQVCIHTQRMLIHEDIYDLFKNQLMDKIQDIKIGDPAEQDTQFASIISEHHTQRIINWVEEAIEEGADALTLVQRQDNIVHPVLLENVKRTSKVYAEEVFGPVVILEKYSSIDQAIESVNDSKFGLQASIFSNQHDVIQQCFHELKVGGVIVNDATTFRVDHMPYGGIKDSGLGREGLKYAIEDMTEERILVN